MRYVGGHIMDVRGVSVCVIQRLTSKTKTANVENVSTEQGNLTEQISQSNMAEKTRDSTSLIWIGKWYVLIRVTLHLLFWTSNGSARGVVFLRMLNDL